MKHGSLAMLDALGFKKVSEKSPDAVLTKLSVLSDHMSEKATMLQENSAARDNTLDFVEAMFLSDTIALGCAYRHEGGVLNYQHTMFTSITQTAALVSRVIKLAAIDDQVLAYREAISSGDFQFNDKRFLAGEAVNDAAEHHEQADAAIVWLTPKAKRLYEAHLCIPRTLTIPAWLVPYDVPIRGVGYFSTYAVNPFASCVSLEDAAKVERAILQSFDSDASLGVAMKKQETKNFLAAALINWGILDVHRAPAQDPLSA